MAGANRINKSDVYIFLSEKKSEAFKALIPLEEKAEKLKKEYINNLLKDIDLEKLFKNTRDLGKDWSDIRDRVSYSYGSLLNISKALTNIKDVEYIFKMVENSINWRTIDKVQKVNDEISDKRDSIFTEYKKLDNMVKSCSTGNKAVRILKEIGFDTSNIKSETKNEILNINVNKEILGIK